MKENKFIYNKEFHVVWNPITLEFRKPKNYRWLIRLFGIFLIGIISLTYLEAKCPKPIKYLTIYQPKNIDVELNDSSVVKELIKQGCQYPSAALAKIHCETANYTSIVCKQDKNLFGYGWNGSKYYHYKLYKESIKDYIKWEKWFIKTHAHIYATEPNYAQILTKFKE